MRRARRSFASATLALAVLALALAGDASAAARPAPCPPRGADVAERSRLAVVYLDRRENRYRGCLRAGGRHHRLGGEAANVARRTIALGGRFVALERHGGCWNACWWVAVFDLRTGARVWQSGPVSVFPEAPTARRIVVSARGRAAYVRDADGVRELRQLDADGDDRLDAGAGIAPRSLRIERGRVRWSNAGQPRSARFDTRPFCARRGSATIERNDVARLYRDDAGFWGCFRGSGRRTPLAPLPSFSIDDGGGNQARLAGRFASIDHGSAGREGANADLRVSDLASGRIVRRWQCCDDGDGSLVVVTLAPTGAVAWTSTRRRYQSLGGEHLHEVHKSDADGNDVLLDASPAAAGGIDPHSLTLDGTTLRWTNANEPRSATLR